MHFSSFPKLQPTGHLLLDGLRDGTYTVSGQIPMRNLFGVRTDVTPGKKEVLLVLHPGGTVVLKVVRADDHPDWGVGAGIEQLNGEPVSFRGSPLATTGPVIEFAAPAGRVRIHAKSQDLERIGDPGAECWEGWVEADVVQGARVEATVRLDTPCSPPGS